VERWERRLWLMELAVRVGWRCTGTKGLPHSVTRRGRAREAGLVLGHAVQGHRACEASTRRGGVERCSGKSEMVRHTHCSERVGVCRRYPHAVTMMCGGVGPETLGTQAKPVERPLGAPNLAPYLLQRYKASGRTTQPSPRGSNVLGTRTHKRRCGEYALTLPAWLAVFGQKAPGVQGQGKDTAWTIARHWRNSRGGWGSLCSAPRNVGRTGGTKLVTSPEGSGWLVRVVLRCAHGI
jgi:hypothetical protein